MSTGTSSPLRVGIVVVAPVVLLAVLGYHPHLPGRQPNVEALAEAVVSDPTRWGLVHLATGVASALLSLAFLAVRAHLREAGEDRWSAAGLPFVVFGGTLYAMLPAMELAPLAAHETDGDVVGAQEALLPLFVPVLVLGGLTFAVGAASFAVAVVRSTVLSPGLARVVAVALVVMALSRFVPLTSVQFFVQGLAALAALLPLAHSMWRQAADSVPGGLPAAPATGRV